MRIIVALLAFILLAPYNVGAAPVVAPTADPSADVVSYLEHIVGWNRGIASAAQLMTKPREAILAEKLHQDMQTVLQKSFDYARAEAAIVKAAQNPSAEPDGAPSNRAQLAQRLTDIDTQIAALQDQLKQPGQNSLQTEQLNGELKLALARQSLLQAVMVLRRSEDDGSLLDQIDTLSRTAAAEVSGAAKPAAPPATSEKAADPGYGIFGLTDALIATSQKQETVDDLLARTKRLEEATRDLIAAKRADLQTVLAQSGTLKPDSAQPADIAAYRKSVDALVGQYKRLAAAIIPLGETDTALETVSQSLKVWRRMIVVSEGHLTHALAVRLVILAISIMVPLICSSVARKTIMRLRDPQKRKQLDLVRRVMLIIALILVILFNFLTEFGSLATFAGFLTAGLAVGLQTVLVSIVAHSLYFGRYGIHVGDRVRVTDVTGEVIQMGLLRLYMRELREQQDGTFAPTGKIVAFPNSILFQPTALYKYTDDLPG